MRQCCQHALLVVAATAIVTVTRSAAQSADSDGRPRIQRAVDASVYFKVERVFRSRLLPTTGTGFFVSERGHVLTNWHVVAPQMEVQLQGETREIMTTTGEIEAIVGSGTGREVKTIARVLVLDRKRDLALVKLPVTPRAWLAVSESAVLGLTDPIWVVGFPFGDLLALNKRSPEVTVSSGRVTSIRHDDKGETTAMQIDAAVNPGNSGGPVLDERGDVVGVVRAGVVGGDATSLAIAPEQVRDFVFQNQVRVTLKPDVVYMRATPIAVRVASMLTEVRALTCRAALRGTNIPPVDQELAWKGEAYEGAIHVPAALAELPAASSYELTIRLATPAGAPALERTFKLVVREQELPQVHNDRPPGSVMRDRQELADRTTTRWVQPNDAGDPGSAKAPRPSRGDALSRLAKDVKLRGTGSGHITITDSALEDERFAVDVTRYEDIETAVLRDIAIEFDRTEYELQRNMRTLQEVKAARNQFGYYGFPHEDPNLLEKRGVELRRELHDRQNRVADAGLCRCRSGKWSLRWPHQSCTTCEVPTAPEARSY